MRYITEIDRRIRTKELETFCDLPVYLRFSGEVSEESAAKFCEELQKAEDHALKSEQKIIPLIIDSYGGSVYALLSMIDAINSCKLPIATVLESKGMSAGAVLFTCGVDGNRFMAPNATLMIHEVASWTGGKVEEMKSSTAEAERLNEKILQIMAKNCGKKKNYFMDLIHEKKHADWFLDANECVKHNIANIIGIPSFKVKISIEQSFCLPEASKEEK